MSGSITATAGTFNFISLNGLMAGLQPQIEDITRPGVSGEAARQLGSRGRRFEMIGVVDCNDLAAANLLEENLESLQGNLVSVTDDCGRTLANCLVWEASSIDKRKIVGASGGISTGKGALLAMRFVLSKAT